MSMRIEIPEDFVAYIWKGYIRRYTYDDCYTYSLYKKKKWMEKIPFSIRICWTKNKGDYWRFTIDGKEKFFGFNRKDAGYGNAHNYAIAIGRFCIDWTFYWRDLFKRRKK